MQWHCCAGGMERKPDHQREELRKPVLALLKAYMACNSAGSDALGGLRALGCFRTSSVAQAYCAALRELVEEDPDLVDMFDKAAIAAAGRLELLVMGRC